jgi:hypothetical protein
MIWHIVLFFFGVIAGTLGAGFFFACMKRREEEARIMEERFPQALADHIEAHRKIIEEQK